MYYINYERDRTYGLYVFSQKMCNDIKLLIRFIYIGMRKRKTNVHTPIDQNNIWLHLITKINNNHGYLCPGKNITS